MNIYITQIKSNQIRIHILWSVLNIRRISYILHYTLMMKTQYLHHCVSSLENANFTMNTLLSWWMRGVNKYWLLNGMYINRHSLTKSIALISSALLHTNWFPRSKMYTLTTLHAMAPIPSSTYRFSLCRIVFCDNVMDILNKFRIVLIWWPNFYLNDSSLPI